MKLEKYARIPKDKGKTHTLGARIPVDIYNDFAAYCSSLGITVSEGVLYLIKEELSSIEQDSPPIAATVEQSKTPVKQRQTTNAGRFNTNAYAVQDELPCPICKTWSSRKNFSRDHLKKHGYNDTQEFFEVHKEAAMQMLAGRKEQP